MRVTLIGANGLLADSVGRYCNLHNHELTVWGLDKPSNHAYSSFVSVNLISGSPDYLTLKYSDVIIYAVGAGIQSNLNESSDLIYNLNLYTPIRICNELDKINYEGTFITFGSYFEIGENFEDIKFNEQELANSQRNVPNDYCVSKRMLTRFVNSKRHKYKHVHAVLPTIYGENESAHRLIPYTVKALKNGDELMFTSGNQVRQYLYIDDVPQILFSLIKVDVTGVFNLPGNETFTVKELVRKIFDFYGKDYTDEIFGSVQRADVGMVNLQMSGLKLEEAVPNFPYSSFNECLKRYDLCL
jgi:nucleoside-diphosphate-sugar epimerase